MTITTYDMPQHSPEWYAIRLGKLTASVVGQLITPKTIKVAANASTRSLTASLVAERITGWTDDNYVSYDMARGSYDEPFARDAYAKWREVDVVEVGFVVREELTWTLGWSPDGLVDSVGCIEIKSRKPKEQLATILDDQVPAENMAQVQSALLVSGREWCDYVSFCGGWPLYVKRVYPETVWQDAIVEAANAFEVAAKHMTSAYSCAVTSFPMTERNPYEMEII